MSAGVKRIVVCEAQVPFVTGGAEYLVRSLVSELNQRGFDAELVSIPFKSYPKEELLSHAASWRLIDLSESNNTPIDLVIATKFPTYFVRHPRKVSWLVHQYRSAYELCGTEFSDFQHTELDVGLREQLIGLDSQMLSESQRLFTIARNVTSRLEKYNGLASEPLYHPPRLAPQLRSGPYENYVLSVGRLELIKRTDLVVRAMVNVSPDMRLLVAGDGTQRGPLTALAEKLGISDRVDFLGSVDDAALLRLYERALCVTYVPYDEDYGYVTLESFLARRPVVTAHDSGGTLEFVEDGVNGLVCFPDRQGLAEGINRLASDQRLATSLGSAGYERARAITWDGVIERLTSVS